MKKILFSIFIISMVIYSCKTEATSNANTVSQTEAVSLGYNNLDVARFKQKIDAGRVVILDVRTAEEYDEGHIKGAINFDVQKPSFTDRIVKLNEEIEYMVYCRSGKRSVTACQVMSKAGLKNVNNLEGGFIAWSKEN